MRVISIDTSSTALGAAIVDDSGVIADCGIAADRQHSEILLPMVEALLAGVKLSLNHMQGIAVTIGPGSFTGLRIGLATAKAWSQALNIPLAGVGTLQALAYTAAEKDCLICPVLNARRGELYAALYQNGACLWPDMPIKPADLAARLVKLNKPIIFCGDGLAAEKEALSAVLGQRMLTAPLQRRLFMAAAAGIIGREKLLKGDIADAAAIEPAYLRICEAEEKRLANKS